MSEEYSYVWNQAAQRYYDTTTGRFVAKAHVMAVSEQSLAASGAAADLMATWAGEAIVAPADWMTMMRREIKHEHIRQYTLGIGGRGRMTSGDWGSIGGMLKEQYGYLDGFYAQIREGTLSEAQIRARSHMYINSGREAFERAQGKVATQSNYNTVTWDVDFSAENCDDCLGLQSIGPQPAPAGGGFPAGGEIHFPGDGQTVCLTNCKCGLVYTNEAGEEFWE